MLCISIQVPVGELQLDAVSMSNIIVCPKFKIFSTNLSFFLFSELSSILINVKCTALNIMNIFFHNHYEVFHSTTTSRVPEVPDLS